jgi:DNA-binding phage protein
MYLYWRIQQDLNCLGEVIRFHDPAFVNALHKWVRKNFSSIARAEGFYPDDLAQTLSSSRSCRN